MSLKSAVEIPQKSSAIVWQDISLIQSLISSHYVAFLWILALLWLASRALVVVRRPKSELIDKLGLTEPAVPEVVIDGLGSSWVSIKWHYPTSPGSSRNKRPKVRKHIIQIGGQITEADRDQRKATLSNLDPDTTYMLTVQAVQNSQTDSTILSSGNSLGSSSGVSLNSLPCPSSNQNNTNLSLGSSRSIYLHTLTSKQDQPPPLETLLRCDIPEFANADKQNINEILDVQKEVREVLNQFTSAENQFIAKHKTLMQEYSELNTTRKEDEYNRTQIRVENKSLEDENHALEVQISKTKLQAAKVAKYKAEAERACFKIKQLEDLQEQRKVENERILDELEHKVNMLQARESQLTQEMKYATQHVRMNETKCEVVRSVIKKLKNLSQTASVEEKLALLYSDDARDLGSATIWELEHEIELDNRIEHEWDRAQKILEKQYVDAYLYNSRKKVQDEHSNMQQPVQLTVQQQQQHQQQPQQHQQHQQHQHQQQHQMNESPQSRSLLNVTPSPTGSNSTVSSLNTGASIPLLQQQSANRHHPAQPLLQGSSNTTLPSMHLPAHSTLSSAPSLMSLQSLNSLTSMHPIQSSSLTPVHSRSASSYDPFVSHPSPVSSLVSQQTMATNQVTSPLPSYQYNQAPPPESAISPSAANDLLPSNLFQDNALENGNDIHEERGSGASSNASIASISSSKRESDAGETFEPSSPRSGRSKDASWIPWLSPHGKSSSNRRTTSLFFGNHADDTPAVTNNQPSFEDKEDNDEETFSAVTEDATTNGRSPLKGMGSRFFQRSGSRSGGFVRRLSLFSRKESDQKIDEKNEEQE